MDCCVNIIIILGQHFTVVQSNSRNKVHHKSFRDKVGTGGAKQTCMKQSNILYKNAAIERQQVMINANLWAQVQKP